MTIVLCSYKVLLSNMLACLYKKNMLNFDKKEMVVLIHLYLLEYEGPGILPITL